MSESIGPTAKAYEEIRSRIEQGVYAPGDAMAAITPAISDVLRSLADGSPKHAYQIERATGQSQSSVRMTLQYLVQHELVTVQESKSPFGPSGFGQRCYSLSRPHPNQGPPRH